MPAERQPLLQRHPGRHALALERGGRAWRSPLARRSRATAWRSTTTATSSSASRSRAASSGCAAMADATSSRSTTGGKYLNSPNDVVTRGSDGSIYFTDPDYGRWNDWIGQERSRDQLGYRGLYRVPPGDGELELRGRRGRVRPAERPVLLARREPPLRQRLRSAQRQGVRRRRRRLARPEPPAARRHRQRRPARGQRRRHGMRRARKRLGHRPGRCLGADARRHAPRRRRDAGGLRQPRVGRARTCARSS